MAQDVGADLWHMAVAVAGFGYKVPGYEAAFCAGILSEGLLIVYQKATRYFNEAHVEFHSGLLSAEILDPVDGKRYRTPSFLIFDEKTRLSGPIATRVKHSYNQRFKWSDDNSEEIRNGWIKVGPSPSELAGQFDLPAGKLQATMTKFNSGCETGGDEFGVVSTSCGR